MFGWLNHRIFISGKFSPYMFVDTNFLVSFENWLEYRPCKVLSGYMDGQKSIIWDDDKSPTADPQITHKLYRTSPLELLISCE